MHKILFVCLVSCFVISCNAGAVSFIKPCKFDDKACLLSSAQAALPHVAAGIPELGVPTADPLVLEEINSKQDGLDIQFKNLKVAGPGKCKFVSISVDGDKSTLTFDVECPITATGQYKVGGKLLVVPIEGEGDCEIKTDKIKLSVITHMDQTAGSDGKQHWNIVSYEHSYEPEEQIHFRLDNLFGGNQEKAQPVMEILNHSWKEVILTIGKPIIAEIIHQAKEVIQSFLHAVPADELFLA
ncbi:circadian clock-controlled protein daywake-like [Pectinophora gossypiella]|uniref:circadian clock-controlled protein daywake-like n=1 Tax=Pectinophora gossypiella TaxID=13191 RepID=UPI00214E0734|nr:circadian clock-controlled protein daywake-like [Pectinophora gossypiella]